MKLFFTCDFKRAFVKSFNIIQIDKMYLRDLLVSVIINLRKIISFNISEYFFSPFKLGPIVLK